MPAPEYDDMPPTLKLQFNIAMGVRKADKERLAILNDVIDRRQADIIKILDEYGIPNVPVVEGDRTRYGNKKKRGDVIPKNE